VSKNGFFIKNLLLILEMAVLARFGEYVVKKPLGVKQFPLLKNPKLLMLVKKNLLLSNCH